MEPQNMFSEMSGQAFSVDISWGGGSTFTN